MTTAQVCPFFSSRRRASGDEGCFDAYTSRRDALIACNRPGGDRHLLTRRSRAVEPFSHDPFVRDDFST